MFNGGSEFERGDSMARHTINRYSLSSISGAAAFSAVLFLSQACSQESPPRPGTSESNQRKIAEEYRAFEQQLSKTLREGATLKSHISMEKSRDFFADRKDAGARFLIAKLDEMNADELRFIAGSADPAKGFEYVSHLVGQGKSNISKFMVCHILADAYPQLSAEVRLASLRAISASFTPSTYGREDLSALKHALYRTGRDGIPILLEKTNHRDEWLRCGVCDDLNDLAKNLSAGNSPPPTLDCKEPAGKRESNTKIWMNWWNATGSRAPFREVPSFFDLYKHFKDRLPP